MHPGIVLSPSGESKQKFFRGSPVVGTARCAVRNESQLETFSRFHATPLALRARTPTERRRYKKNLVRERAGRQHSTLSSRRPVSGVIQCFEINPEAHIPWKKKKKKRKHLKKP